VPNFAYSLYLFLYKLKNFVAALQQGPHIELVPALRRCSKEKGDGRGDVSFFTMCK